MPMPGPDTPMLQEVKAAKNTRANALKELKTTLATEISRKEVAKEKFHEEKNKLQVGVEMCGSKA